MQIEDQLKELNAFTEERLREVSLAIEEKSKEFNSIMDQKMKILQQNRKELNIHRK